MKKIGTLYGIGVGPGKAGLLTLKALDVLRSVDVICAPVSGEGKESVALRIVRDKVKKNAKVLTPVFPMSKDVRRLEKHWDKAIEKIYEELKKGKDVAFITIGDPLFYSTYVNVMERIRDRFPDVRIETIPGVTSLSACLAELNLPLAGRDERIAILPAAYGLDNLEEIAKQFDSIVLMKVSRNFDKIVEKIEKAGLKKDAVFLSGCGSRDFFSSPLDSMAGKDVGYFSMIIIRGQEK